MTSTSARPLALITGASSGIGLELAKQFADHGYDLVISAEDGDGIADAKVELSSHGTDVRTVQADLSRAEGVERLARDLESEGRPLDAAAINAGVGVGGAFTETSLDDELELVDLNVRGTVHLAKKIIGPMVERGEGKILFTSSVAAEMPSPYEAVYAASKSFVQSFSEAIGEEVRGSGVTVTAIMPGPTGTNFFHRAGMDDTRIGSSSKDDPALVAKNGYDALMNGRRKSLVGGLMSTAIGVVSAVLPDVVKAKAHIPLAKPRPRS